MADDISVVIGAKIDQLVSGLDQATSTIRGATTNISSEMKRGSQATTVLGDSMNDLRHTLLGMIDPIRGVYNGVGELAEAFAAAFAVEKIAEFAKRISELGADALHMSFELGISTEAISHFNFAAGAMGQSADAGGMALVRLEKSASMAAGGEKTYAEAWEALGIKVTDGHGKLKQMDQLLPEIANKFQATADGPNKTAIAMELMGRSGAKMIPLLDQGSEGLEKMNAAADAAGVTISGPMAEGMEKTSIQFYDLGQSVEGVAITLYEAFKPAIDVVLDLLIGLVQSFNNNIKTGGDFNHTLGLIVIAVDSVIAVLSGAVTGFEILFDIMEVGATAILGPLMVLGRVIYDVFSGHWAQAQADAKAGLDAVGQLVEDKLADIVKKGQLEHDELVKLFSNITTGLGVDTTGGGAGEKPAAKPDLPPINRGGDKAAELARKLADEKLQAAEKEALEEIKIEEEKNRTLYAMGQITLDEYVAQQVTLEDRKYAVQLDYMQKRAVADTKDKLAHQKDLDAIKLLQETHEEALLKIHNSALIKKQQDDRQDLETWIKQQQEKLTDTKADLDQEEKEHLINAQEKAEAERNLTLAVERQILARKDAEIANLKAGTDAWKAAMKQREDLARQFANDVKKINNEATNDEMQKWNTFSSSVKSSFNSAMNGMILGTQTWQQSLGQIIDGVATAFLEMGEKILEDWIEQQIAKALLTKTTDTASALGQISAAAGVAGANAFASTAAIPIVGPELAPAAAAGAVSATLAFSSLAVAEKGMVLDRDRLVSAHEEEMILPAPLSRGVQDIIAHGKTGGGDTHLNYSPTINAPEHPTLEQLLSSESRSMVSWINAKMRDGTIKARPV